MSMSAEITSAKTVVWFDGSCPICRREVGHYRRIDRRSRINFIDLSHDPGLLNALGVATGEGMRRLHAMRSDGVIVDGAYAFAVIWNELPGYKWLAKLLYATCFLSALDRAYETFARWRLRRQCARAGYTKPCRATVLQQKSDND